ncbi:MAG: GAF domain-containing protein [Deltaproteobacteria bacterium]|nr:GAF domain-containing protein [Deltaproteobacteria bacterium]
MPHSVLQASYIHVIPPILGFFVMIGLSLVSMLRGRRNPTNRLFAVVAFLGALLNADVALITLIPDKGLALHLERFTYLFFVFSVPVYIQFVHTFLGMSGRRWIEILAYLFAVGLLFFIPTPHFIAGFHYYRFGVIAKGGPAFHVYSVGTTFTVIYCLATLYSGMKEAGDNLQRNRIKYILGGMGLSALLIGLNVLPVGGLDVYPMSNFSFIPAVFLAFGVLKYDLLDIGAVIRRGTVYFLLTGVLTALYVLVITLFNVFFMGAGAKSPLILPFVLALLIVLLFNPIRVRVQLFIDRLFFRGRYDYQGLLRDISARMTSLLRFEQVRSLLLRSINDAIPVAGISLWLLDNEGSVYREREAGASAQGDLEGPLLEKDHPLIGLLERYRRPLMKSVVDRQSLLREERERIFRLFDESRTSLIVPMVSKGRLIGMIALGQKKSGELFVHEDLELLSTLANQSAIAIENARIYEEIEALNRDLERKVEERTADLRKALEEKERTQRQLIQSESLAAIGQLVAGTAHELNNPLAAASSLIETGIEEIGEWTLKEGEEAKDDVLDDLRFSLKELKRAGDIVKSLLGLSRQGGDYVEDVDIHSVLEDALRVLYNQYKYLNIEIEKRYGENLPAIEGNFANLGQVFINILKNAFQSLAEQGGRIVLTTAYREEADSVVITCRDTGPGIPEESLKDVFKPFFTTKTTREGTGLGLYISHEIIRRHGGEISVRSRTGEGAVFTVLLPCRRRKG